MSGVAYGLRVSAPWPLPELGRSRASAAVIVRLGRTSARPRSDAISVSWPEIGRFVVRGGDEIVITPSRGVSRSALRLYLLGPVFAALLHQRGLFLLHASAVSVGGRAVAFLGEVGAGKSTTAAALIQRGHGFLADDVVALAPAPDGRFVVLPAFPQLKLWPEAAQALGLPADLPRVYPTADKRAVQVRAEFVSRPQPLARAYVLQTGQPSRTAPVTGAAALLAVLRHSYGRRVLQADRIAAHFADCAAVTRPVTFRTLTSERRLSALSDLARVVEDDLA